MKSLPFVGRKVEAQKLAELLDKKTASLVVIKGRRRVGKSRLIEEFTQGQSTLKFSGLALDEHTTAQDQRDHFGLQLSRQTGLPEIKMDDWSKLLLLLADRVKKGRVIILLDEITWMADKDPTFLSKLQSVWEQYFQKNAKLILILCGSVSAWIEKNILSSTGFYGRVTQVITLKELSLHNSNKLLTYLGFKRSSYEKFMMLSVVGGIPWYIEQIYGDQSASDNIKRLCFSEDALLVLEFNRIFSDLFGRRGDIHKKIVNHLANGSSDYESLAQAVGYYSGGSMSEYLNELILSGFVRREFAWQLKTHKEQKHSKYRLSDNYLRFYLKYIKPRLNKINGGKFEGVNITTLPAYESIFGLQFENLILNNRKLLIDILRLNPEDIVNDNPYFQKQTLKQKSCQIDYLLQTKYNTLYVCEIKFSRKPIGGSIVRDMQEKISRINMPKGFAAIPVLIHVNGVDDAVIEKNYFGKIIDFSAFLEMKE